MRTTNYATLSKVILHIVIFIINFLVLAARESDLKKMKRRIVDLEELPKQHEAAKADLNAKLKNSDKNLRSANKCANS